MCSQQIARSSTDKNGTQQILFISFSETVIVFRVVNTEATSDTAMAFYWLGLFKQQWGLNAGRTVNYPIPLTALYSILAIDAASDFDAVQVCNVNNVNLTSAVIFQMRLAAGDILPEHMTAFYWLLAGQAQQWGYITLASQGTATLPLPFSDTNYVITTGQQRTSNNGFVQITGRTANNVSFKFEWDSGQNKSGHCWWITCGKQQWGDGTTTFPIAMLSIFAIAVSNGSNSTTSLSFRCNAYNISTTGFSIYQVGDMRWIGVGQYKQMQWGLWSQNNTYANVLFTFAYPQQCLNVIASDYNDTSNDTEGIGEALLISDITVNGFRVSKQTTSVQTIWISLGI